MSVVIQRKSRSVHDKLPQHLAIAVSSDEVSKNESRIAELLLWATLHFRVRSIFLFDEQGSMVPLIPIIAARFKAQYQTLVSSSVRMGSAESVPPSCITLCFSSSSDANPVQTITLHQRAALFDSSEKARDATVDLCEEEAEVEGSPTVTRCAPPRCRCDGVEDRTSALCSPALCTIRVLTAADARAGLVSFLPSVVCLHGRCSIAVVRCLHFAFHYFIF